MGSEGVTLRGGILEATQDRREGATVGTWGDDLVLYLQ